jgi:uncharacterized protein YhhL (DUF1145 family)
LEILDELLHLEDLDLLIRVLLARHGCAIILFYYAVSPDDAMIPRLALLCIFFFGYNIYQLLWWGRAGMEDED